MSDKRDKIIHINKCSEESYWEDCERYWREFEQITARCAPRGRFFALVIAALWLIYFAWAICLHY